MGQSPSMRRILTEMRKKREQDLRDARARIEEIRQAVGLDPEESFDGMDGDDNLLLAAKAMQEKQRHDAQCAKCPYSVETCEQCRYNGSDFQSRRFSNPYLRCVKPCGKYRARMEQKRIAKLMGESGMGVRFRCGPSRPSTRTRRLRRPSTLRRLSAPSSGRIRGSRES